MIVKRYGYDFDTSLEDENGYQIWDELGIEMWMIRKGEEWLKSRGSNLSAHFENCRRIIWPELDAHRWHNLCRDEILSHKVCVLLGCGSSGKTHEAAWISLLDYWCHPQDTCVLVSSTDIRGLKKRVWGEVAMLWERGVERFPKLGGHLLDSAIAITTDSMEDCEPGQRKSRDMRRGVFGIPCVQGGRFVGLAKFMGVKQKRMRLVADEACFPAGTLVDTPSGKRKIEDIKRGDLVVNALGISMVANSMVHSRSSLVRVNSNGRSIVCTPNHPFFTNKGWKKACELDQSCYMLSAYEAMSILRGEFSTNIEGFALQKVRPENDFWNLQTMRKDIPKEKVVRQKKLLQSILLVEAYTARPGSSKEVLYQGAFREDSEVAQKTFRGASREICADAGKTFGWNGTLHEFSNGGAKAGPQRQHESNPEIVRTQAAYPWRKWNWTDKGGTYAEESHPRTSDKCDCEDWNEGWLGIPSALQAGLWNSGVEVWGGGRRGIAPALLKEGAGCKENELSNGSWVDSVEVLEQEDFERFGGSEGRVDVYNLEIEGHPSFSVGGLLVHNSAMSSDFLSAFANLNKNEDFRAIVLGNPNEPTDPLGRAAEPRDGWTEDFLNPTKTRCWDTRFMNGRCVNLVGLDSPNFDFPEDKPTRYKYLISREKIADTLSFFNKDSMEYYSQCVGTMKIGMVAKRVLTRQMCEQYGAQRDVFWKDGERTKVYFVDSSYGGDRCVAGWAEFGFDVDGKQVLSLHEPKIIPISITVGQEPEVQIAKFVHEDCELEKIPPANMGHDSTGRGGLGTALAREWSAETHPIDSGGRPTDRPVSLEILVDDPETGMRRPVRCDEWYDRLVTEFWFSVRYAVEAGQIRNLPGEPMEELCARIWGKPRGKYSIEVKDGTPSRPGYKQRMGRSCDMGDWAAGIVEMARRKGFIISKLGNASRHQSQSSLQRLAKETQELLDKRLIAA